MSKAAEMYLSTIKTLRKHHESLYGECLEQVKKAADSGEVTVDLIINDPKDLKGIGILAIEDGFRTVRWCNKTTVLRLSWRHFNAGSTEGSE